MTSYSELVDSFEMFAFVSSVFLILIFYMKSLPALETPSKPKKKGSKDNTKWFNRVRFGANVLLVCWIISPLFVFTMLTIFPTWNCINFKIFLIASSYAQLGVIFIGGLVWGLDFILTFYSKRLRKFQIKQLIMPEGYTDSRAIAIAFFYFLITVLI